MQQASWVWAWTVLAVLAVSTVVSSGAGASEMQHFTPEWEARYTHELQTAHPQCVGCNAIVPFAVPGRAKSCISHCELVVSPEEQSSDEVCEDKCWQLRLAKAVSHEPCVALGLCPAALISSVSPTRAVVDVRARHVRPLVVVSGGDASAALETLVLEWIDLTLPDAHVRRLVFTDYVLDDEPTASKERAYTTFRPLHEQVERMCDLVDADPNLSNGFDVLAFGQGGLVARGYVQRCNNPRVHTFVTYNTPHAGCASQGLSEELLALEMKGGGFGPSGGQRGRAWSEYAHIIQSNYAAAGYFRDPRRLEEYLEFSNFLPDVNLERKARDEGSKGYRAELKTLEKLVLIKGERDSVIDPPSSAWFETYQTDDRSQVGLLKDSALYRDLGLYDLDVVGRLKVSHTCSIPSPQSQPLVTNFTTRAVRVLAGIAKSRSVTPTKS